MRSDPDIATIGSARGGPALPFALPETGQRPRRKRRGGSAASRRTIDRHFSRGARRKSAPSVGTPAAASTSHAAAGRDALRRLFRVAEPVPRLYRETRRNRAIQRAWLRPVLAGQRRGELRTLDRPSGLLIRRLWVRVPPPELQGAGRR